MTSPAAPDAAPDAAISVRGLRKVYRGGKEALRGIDLDVPRGAIFGLLGPNGAGKSTFINILAGLTIKTAGQVRIWGFDQDRNPRQSRAAIGVVPQELNIDPFFTPRAALEVQAGLYGVPRARRRTDEILAKVGLADKAEAYARTLSGGMRRRLLVAKALVHDPAVLVLDEPTAGVDIELRRMLWDYVRELNARGVTIILTTHYLEEAEEMCDRIAVIGDGRLIACDDKAALLSRLDERVLAVRIEPEEARAQAARLDLPGGARAHLRADGWLEIAYRRGATDPGALIARIERAQGRIVDLSTREPDLEDVFMSLLREAGAARDRAG
ncbi:ABC transporter ATP-binding protein [Oceanicella actignis]|uniref:ABC-2 type transport system ATP-binding protein n=1 Tax=Oceanicella actignis TaxID=1189325 RepID=A0A1M7TYM9_9RHOB|nr:ABC transporter ATP-binding protein [Oceanicella actignis]SET81831.1 ABC-2 type transport system ATP-binding protein [Oceanicella actignis]SHN75763.1 ABC-2 type transport system ATP-binding protein [Oceanicella actignis]